MILIYNGEGGRMILIYNGEGGRMILNNRGREDDSYDQ